jgi:23S rRNA pseudouridine1911/1915/1917 synthase
MPEIKDTKEEDELFEHHHFVVDAGQEPLRIDKFLTAKIANISRSKIQNAMEAGFIIVNGTAVKSNYKIKPNDDIKILMPYAHEEKDILPENIALDIVYEDDDLLIVNKPAGMVVHPAIGNYTGTLINALLYHFKNLPKQKGNEARPGLVHRIDKNTSGLLVVAKTEVALNSLSMQFFKHTIERVYYALVWGDFTEDKGTIEGHIARHQKNRQVMDVYPEGDKGKAAVTHYKVIERMTYVTLVECTLETGRTHQIRAHMQHIGHPLFNDATYGGDKIVKGTVYTRYKQFVENCFEMMPRQALHAKSLGFIHPITKKHVFFDSPLPEDFSNVLDNWRKFTRALKKV